MRWLERKRARADVLGWKGGLAGLLKQDLRAPGEIRLDCAQAQMGFVEMNWMRLVWCTSRVRLIWQLPGTVVEEAKCMRRVGKKRKGAVGSTEHVLMCEMIRWIVHSLALA